MHESDLIALVRKFVDGVENLDRDIGKLNANKVAAYQAAKASGVDPKALKAVIGYRRKRAKNPSAVAEAESLFKEYLGYADGSAPHAHAPARVHLHAREEAEEADPTMTAPEGAAQPTLHAGEPEDAAPATAPTEDTAPIEAEAMAEVREPNPAAPRKAVEIEGEATEVVETAPVQTVGRAITLADLDDLLGDLDLEEAA